MRVDHITDHALLRFMERAYGIDVEAWRTLLRDELTASLAVTGRQRALSGPAFILSPDASSVITYLDESCRSVRPMNGCIAIPRYCVPETTGEATEAA